MLILHTWEHYRIPEGLYTRSSLEQNKMRTSLHIRKRGQRVETRIQRQKVEVVGLDRAI